MSGEWTPRDQKKKLRNEFLRDQYRALREEIRARITARRRLLAAGIAFLTAFLGYSFTSGSTPSSRAWLIAFVPPFLAFIVFEVVRSQFMMDRAAKHVMKIEKELLPSPNEFGWEHTESGPTNNLTHFDIFLFVAITMIYIASSLFAVLLWQYAPPFLEFVTREKLGAAYVLIGFFDLFAIAPVYWRKFKI